MRLVRITLEVEGHTDRDPWDWGEGLARTLGYALEDASVNIECVDADLVGDPENESPRA